MSRRAVPTLAVTEAEASVVYDAILQLAAKAQKKVENNSENDCKNETTRKSMDQNQNPCEP